MQSSFRTTTFTCAKCGGRKPLEGRTKYKAIKKDSVGRNVYSYQCKDCKNEDIG